MSLGEPGFSLTMRVAKNQPAKGEYGGYDVRLVSTVRGAGEVNVNLGPAAAERFPVGQQVMAHLAPVQLRRVNPPATSTTRRRST